MLMSHAKQVAMSAERSTEFPRQTFFGEGRGERKSNDR